MFVYIMYIFLKLNKIIVLLKKKNFFIPFYTWRYKQISSRKLN